jgi:SAM-dependent methyltransferase
MSGCNRDRNDKSLSSQNLMHPIRWVPPDASALLDIGCNAGDFLTYCRQLFPQMRLAGVDVNPQSVQAARRSLPGAVLQVAGADALPFHDEAFDCVTCVEVLEHVPQGSRSQSLIEARRVLRPGGRFILRVPHAGVFAWLDANNFRFRMPHLYKALVGQGRRDAGFFNGSEGVVWHHHFTLDELMALLGSGWELEARRTGGLLLFPLGDIARWPLSRMRLVDNSLSRAIHRVMNFDLGHDYGAASYDILLVLRRS